ncbi:hypothetical protein S40288_08756 [Stachybotrys chartarum IBT 40288]|nr:hypothetical protein S40288_08756 [Stachybotrys chartarum IBT 40288]
MGRYELQYPKNATNILNVYHGLTERPGNYELETIHKLVNTCPILHVSFTPPDSPFPVTLPMVGQMGSFARPSADLGDPLDLYLHGYVSSRIMNLARAAGPDGLPMCVAASHVDGLVLALSAFSHSYNYRSAVLFGHATLVEDNEEKVYAMELITDSVVPGRWKDTRLPPKNSELQSTSVLRVKIASGSAKIREGGAKDDKHDLEDEQVVGGIWTGVLPVHQTVGEPIPASHNKKDLPASISNFIKDSNALGKQHSVDVARK